MANEQNLRPCEYKFTQEDVKKGQENSAKARRKRKALKEELLLLLSDGDIQKRISLALIDEALNGNRAGSVTTAFEVIRDTIGEKPVEKVEVGKIDKEQSMQELKELFDDE